MHISVSRCLTTALTLFQAICLVMVFQQSGRGEEPAGARSKVDQTQASIPGYRYGDSTLKQSPISLADLDLLKKSVLFSEEDERYLKMAGEVLVPQTEAILDVWYGFVASNPHLVYYFSGKDGKPDAAYLASVRKRFGQWISDVCNRPYDQAWLDYQSEIGRRHHRAGKNETDRVKSASEIVHARYLIAFVYPITATIEPFLAAKGHSKEEIEKMHQAWFKSIVLHVAVWSSPYMTTGTF